MPAILHPIIEKILSEKDLTPDDRAAFLSPSFEEHLHDPFSLHQMREGVLRVHRALCDGEHIALYADFDCDGIPGATLMRQALTKLGAEKISTYIPHRHDEGYGLHLNAIEKLRGDGVSLIIAIDVGTMAHAAITHAREQGIDVIVIDHHEPSGTLPDAVAVINPKVLMDTPYPFPHLCGTAVAFKFAQALISYLREERYSALTDVPIGWEKWLLDLVAIATVADMVPLVGENRTLSHFGLQVLRKSSRPGVHSLVRRARITQSSLTEEDIGFAFAPRINAASRMDNPELAHALLSATLPEEAETLSLELEKLNTKRKATVAQLTKEARAKLVDGAHEHGVLVIGDPSWKPSLLGLVANALLGNGVRMACVWGRDGNGTIKGSCRSDGSISVAAFLHSASGIVTEGGGHAQAGGFSVPFENIHTLREDFAQIAESAAQFEKEVRTCTEIEIEPRDLSFSLYENLRVLAPFGIGNEKPLFRMRIRVDSVRAFGKEGVHTELVCSEGDKKIRCFDFFRTPDSFSSAPVEGNTHTIVGSLERDTFRGNRVVALRIVDVL